MPVIVVRRRPARDQVHESIDALSLATACQVVMPRTHARVDDRDADPEPVVAQLLPYGSGADCGAGPSRATGREPVEGEVIDKRILRKPVERRVGYFGDVAIDDRKRTFQLAASSFNDPPALLKGGGLECTHIDLRLR